jgi:hypothetical protein
LASNHNQVKQQLRHTTSTSIVLRATNSGLHLQITITLHLRGPYKPLHYSPIQSSELHVQTSHTT